MREGGITRASKGEMEGPPKRREDVISALGLPRPMSPSPLPLPRPLNVTPSRKAETRLSNSAPPPEDRSA